MIDILLATYNGGNYIREQLKSIFNQSYKDFTLIIRDDLSTDNTLSIIEEFRVLYPEKIIVLTDELGRLGASNSFMTLLKYSNADYVMFCDQDDVWLENKIELTIKKMKGEEKGKINFPLMVFTDLKVVDEKMEIISRSFWDYQKLDISIIQNWKKLLAQNVITGCTIMINKYAKQIVLPFKFENKIMHDQWIGVNVSKYGEIYFIENPTILYRQHSNNVDGAHLFNFSYVKNKMLKFKNNISFFYTFQRYFNDVSLIELIYFKMTLTLKRLIS